MKLLSFLGTGKYSPTTYVWNGKEHLTEYAPVASYHFLKPQEIVVFLTEEARETHFETFRQQLPEGLPIETRNVPKGQNEAELWQVFAEIANAVKPKEQVAFDITHGLRHFQIVGMLAAAFLRSGLDVRVEAVLYGGYEVRDQETNRTPMFDLTPLITLLEWATAADRFNRTGDSRYLASLLREQRKVLAERDQAEGKKDLSYLNAIGSLGEHGLSKIFQGLSLVRPYQVMQSVSELEGKVEDALPVLEQAAGALPFRLILDSVLESYKPLGLNNPKGNPRADLATQREIIKWYAEHEHWQQAVTLAREWLLSWFMYHLGLHDFTSWKDRSDVESKVNSAAEELKKSKENNQGFSSPFSERVPDVKTALWIWKSLADVRNDINHAGMRERAKNPKGLISSIRSHLDKIYRLPI